MRWTVRTGEPVVVPAGTALAHPWRECALAGPAPVGEHEWIHLVVGPGSSSEDVAQLARWPSTSAADLSCELRLLEDTAPPSCGGDGLAPWKAVEGWDSVEGLLATVGSQAGMLMVGLDDLARLTGEPLCPEDAAELVAGWAAMHGLCLVVLWLDGSQAVAVKPDGRQLRHRLPEIPQACGAVRSQRLVGAEATAREHFARHFLDAYLADPSDLDGCLAQALLGAAAGAAGQPCVTTAP